jgi:hypothetical protein
LEFTALQRGRCASRGDPLGYVHDTIGLVLAGKRKGRPHQLNSSAVFFDFLQGILHSCISNALKSVVAERVHVPIGPDDGPDSPYVDPEAPADVAREVALAVEEIPATCPKRSANNLPIFWDNLPICSGKPCSRSKALAAPPRGAFPRLPRPLP